MSTQPDLVCFDELSSLVSRTTTRPTASVFARLSPEA
jgi:hypothetical protein